MALRDVSELMLMREIAVCFSQATDMHRRDLRKCLQHMVRTDLVAAIWWERQAMGEKEDFTAHPSPRAISGPSRLAIGNGSFFHKAIRAWYCSLVGSASRASCPGAVQLA